jgi:hypothetical protein
MVPLILAEQRLILNFIKDMVDRRIAPRGNDHKMIEGSNDKYLQHAERKQAAGNLNLSEDAIPHP